MGSLIYLTATRPDLSYDVSFISRFMTAPDVKHWTTAKRALRYVKGTLDIMHSRSKDPRLDGFIDSNWGGFVGDRKSISGYVFNLGTSAITWTSKKQQAVALSLTKAEYQTTVKAVCEAIWLKRMLSA